MHNNQDIRWQQRFQNYSKAFALLRAVVEENDDILSLSDLEKEGLIKRFEFTLELAWKTIKDKMEYDGMVFDKSAPRYVFKLAYQHKYIDNIDIWLKMLGDRNLMSHTYNFSSFNAVLASLKKDYYPELDKLHIYFIEEHSK